ncbi:MAG: sodium-dependent transporter [Pirellulales bacterium]|nr:sodium-dependent transporter [Pirellulales bacterium]MBX3434057.1 sodium-dependent transporter [Pirellulales bacterium]
MSNQPAPRVKPAGDQWASRIGVILAVAGSAVGLGNFLRFPGNAAQNGGGAFMLPYFISLLLLGIPLCWAEWTMGRYGGGKGFNSAPGIYSVIWRHKLARYFGSIALLIPLVIYMYYVHIEAWCLGYAWDYLVGNMESIKGEPAAYKEHFVDFVGAGTDGFIYEGGNNSLVVILAAVFTLNFVFIYRGLAKGIETFCKFAMPLMAMCALCVLVRVLTLDGEKVIAGLGEMWNPKPEELWNPKTWLAASGQIFFSLSVGFGIIVNYSSYLKKDDDIALSGLAASSVNEFFEVCLGGLITLPAAFIFLGATMRDSTGSSFALGFHALPCVFAEMPAGRFFGFCWFFMLFLAAITSSVSMLQPVIAFFEEGLGLKRHASVTLLGLIAAFGTGFVVFFSKDIAALDTLDFWVGTVLIFILAMIQSLIYGWALGIEEGEKELHRGAHIRVPRIVQYVLKYVTPVYLLAIFAGICYTQGPEYAKTLSTPGVPQYAVMVIATVLVFLLILVHIAGKRWEREGKLESTSERHEPRERSSDH